MKRLLIRMLTGTGYLAVLLGFFCLRRYSHILWFDLLLLLFALIGTFEMLRAFGDRIDRVQRALVCASSAAVLVCYALSAYFLRGYAAALTFAVGGAGALALLCPLVFRHEGTSLESVGDSFLAFVYPSLFLLALSALNHLPAYSEIGILFVFAICPFADSLAYVFGVLGGKKFKKKMSPHVSPNKTVVGGIGGLFGGALGAVILFFVQFLWLDPAFSGGVWVQTAARFPLAGELVFYILLGIFVAAAAEIGDLAESAVKRKIGIKDMGKLLPGHGGILDRIDSALYAGVAVYLVFLLRIMFAG